MLPWKCCHIFKSSTDVLRQKLHIAFKNTKIYQMQIMKQARTLQNFGISQKAIHQSPVYIQHSSTICSWPHLILKFFMSLIKQENKDKDSRPNSSRSGNNRAEVKQNLKVQVFCDSSPIPYFFFPPSSS